MSLRYRNGSGEETIIAGLTPGGDIEAGAVATRTGKVDVSSLEVGAYQVVNVTFDTPMPDDTYIINIDCTSGRLNIATFNKTANGFSIVYLNSSNLTQPQGDSIDWTATKTYTVQHAQQNAESIATLEAMVPAGAGAGNKLVTASQLTNTTTPISDAVADIQDLIPVGASITNQLVTASQASVDNALSTTSDHAVQNKVVKAALDNKQDTLTFDNTPTAGSNNPVTSAGIKAAIDDNYRLMSINGAKNMVYYKPETRTVTGVTYTVENGVITTSNTASALSYFASSPVKLKAGVRYKLSGCPSGGSEQTYFLQAIGTGLDKKDYGNGHTFTCSADVDDVVIRPVYMAGTAAGHTFYPMLRLAQDPDNDFQPYGKTNQELSEDIKNIKGIQDNVNYNGCKNLLPSNNTTETVAEVTYTKQSDGSYIVTGATTSASPCYHDVVASYTLPKGTYILSSGANLTSNIELVLDNITSGSSVRVMTLIDSRERTFTLSSDSKLHCYMWVNKSTTLPTEGVHFYPMIRRAEDTDSTYQPYTMTNKELTDALTVKRITIANRVDIKSYNQSTQYTIPSDGYVSFCSANNQESILNVNSIGISSSNNSVRNAIFVKGGMIIHFEGNAPSWAWYYPLIK